MHSDLFAKHFPPIRREYFLDEQEVITALDKLAYLETYPPESDLMQDFVRRLRIQICESVNLLEKTVQGTHKWAFYTGKHGDLQKAVVIDDLPDDLLS